MTTNSKSRPPLASRLRASLDSRRFKQDHQKSVDPRIRDAESLRPIIEETLKGQQFQDAIAANLADLIKPSIKDALDTIQPVVEAVYAHEMLLRKTNSSVENLLARLETEIRGRNSKKSVVEFDNEDYDGRHTIRKGAIYPSVRRRNSTSNSNSKAQNPHNDDVLTLMELSENLKKQSLKIDYVFQDIRPIKDCVIGLKKSVDRNNNGMATVQAQLDQVKKEIFLITSELKSEKEQVKYDLVIQENISELQGICPEILNLARVSHEKHKFNSASLDEIKAKGFERIDYTKTLKELESNLRILKDSIDNRLVNPITSDEVKNKSTSITNDGNADLFISKLNEIQEQLIMNKNALHEIISSFPIQETVLIDQQGMEGKNQSPKDMVSKQNIPATKKYADLHLTDKISLKDKFPDQNSRSMTNQRNPTPGIEHNSLLQQPNLITDILKIHTETLNDIISKNSSQIAALQDHTEILSEVQKDAKQSVVSVKNVLEHLDSFESNVTQALSTGNAERNKNAKILSELNGKKDLTEAFQDFCKKQSIDIVEIKKNCNNTDNTIREIKRLHQSYIDQFAEFKEDNVSQIGVIEELKKINQTHTDYLTDLKEKNESQVELLGELRGLHQTHANVITEIKEKSGSHIEVLGELRGLHQSHTENFSKIEEKSESQVELLGELRELHQTYAKDLAEIKGEEWTHANDLSEIKEKSGSQVELLGELRELHQTYANDLAEIKEKSGSHAE
ncbi:hypothetical protein GcM3_220011, partial [Golovinomyces cichoracearum]